MGTLVVTMEPEPWALVPGILKEEKLCFLSVFSLFPSLFLSSYVHTLWVLLSLINFTKVNCEGKLKKGVPYKL
jgi:hypothetical protein